MRENQQSIDTSETRTFADPDGAPMNRSLLQQDPSEKLGITAMPSIPTSVEDLLYAAKGKAHVLAMVFDRAEELHLSWDPPQQLMGLHQHCKDIVNLVQAILDALPNEAMHARPKRRVDDRPVQKTPGTPSATGCWQE